MVYDRRDRDVGLTDFAGTVPLETEQGRIVAGFDMRNGCEGSVT